MQTDVVVLGAGIVGVSVAVHLARRGKSVVLVDRQAPGEGTSFGNAGLIQSESVYPYAFPRDPLAILRYAGNRTTDAHYHLTALPRIAPFLARFWWHSEPRRHDAIAHLYAPLITHAISEHADLIAAAGADDLVRRDGWLAVFRTTRARDAAFAEREHLATEFGVNSAALLGTDLARVEPDLQKGLAGAVHWQDPWSVTNPSGLVKAYARLFETLGGRLATGDAATLAPKGHGWRVATADGAVEAEHAVVALGPWSDVVTRLLGYRLPLAAKRGYHMHYAPRGNARLGHTVLDAEGGYLLAPMDAGIRLTTGIEFADRDAPPTPVQLSRAEPKARAFFPLGERRDARPWMGLRPCTPDMMPLIGPAPRHEGLWFAFGHAHHGLTLGPVTGRLIAEALSGETPLVDIAPYAPSRFGS